MRKLLTLLLLTCLVSLAAAQTTITPEEQNVINDSATEDPISSSPFQANRNGTNLTVSPDFSFQPGTYNQTIKYSGHTEYYQLKLEKVQNITVTPQQFQAKVEVGTNPSFSNITVQLEGNEGATLTTRITGRIQSYIETTPSIDVFPGISKQVTLSFNNLPKNTEIGNYTGKLFLEKNNFSKNVSLKFRFQDKIAPEIEQTSINDFQATRPEPFKITASDNLRVEKVRAEIIETETFTVNETEKHRNNTVETLDFEPVNNTEEWKATATGDKRGEYWITGYIEDAAGNRDNFTEKYTVKGLDQIETEKDISFKTYRVEEEIKQEIANLKIDTDLDVRLESFNQPLDGENETWTVGLEGPERKQTFNSVNSTLKVSKKGKLELFVFGDSPEKFDGRLEFQGVEQHVEIEDLTFNGQYLNCTVPQRQEYSIYGKNITFEPVNSDRCGKAGWEINYFIPAETVPAGSNLRKNLRTVVPAQVIDQREDFEENVKNRLKGRVRSVGTKGFFYASMNVFFLFYILYIKKIQPYIWHFPARDSERKIHKIKRWQSLDLFGYGDSSHPKNHGLDKNQKLLLGLIIAVIGAVLIWIILL